MILVKILAPVQLPGVYSVPNAGAVAGCYATGEVAAFPTLIAQRMVAAGVAETWDAGSGAGNLVPAPWPQDQAAFIDNN